MTDLLILGTDTDAGKTTFALLWLAALGDTYEYWKPVESGASDSERVKELVPTAWVHPPSPRRWPRAWKAELFRRPARSPPPSPRRITSADDCSWRHLGVLFHR